VLATFELEVTENSPGNSQQIFNQAVYDYINSVLDELRPYGLRGMPSMNFIHNHKVRDENNRLVIDYSNKMLDIRLNRVPRYDDVVSHIESRCRELLKVRLGLFLYDVDSER
jgi:hypothetical protein